MHSTQEKLKKVWNQKQIPVVLRRTGKGQQLRVRLPYNTTNCQWLQNGRKISPAWIKEHRCWELPKAWFNDFVDRSLAKYGKVYTIQPYGNYPGDKAEFLWYPESANATNSLAAALPIK